MLFERLKTTNSSVWLINTGWTGGKYGYGTRIPLVHTRAMIHAAINGMLSNIPIRKDKWFNLNIPETCPDVPSDLLLPETTWKSQLSYAQTATDLIRKFSANFEKYKNTVPDEVLKAGLFLH